MSELRERVRDRYAAAAKVVATGRRFANSENFFSGSPLSSIPSSSAYRADADA
jgi:hypothetical protein